VLGFVIQSGMHHSSNQDFSGFMSYAKFCPLLANLTPKCAQKWAQFGQKSWVIRLIMRDKWGEKYFDRTGIEPVSPVSMTVDQKFDWPDFQ